MSDPDTTAPGALVSVLVRSMDRSNLAQALQSVEDQSYQDVELILVNAKGGHHRDYAGEARRVPIHLVNQGGAALTRPQAANAGLAAASGRYLTFLDDDDTIDRDHLKNLVQAIQAEPDGAVVYAGVRCIDRADPEQKVTRVFGTTMGSRAQLLAGNFIPIHGPLFPGYMRRYARFDEGLLTYEDWDFWLQLAQHARFVYTHAVTATYFTGGTSGVSPQVPDMDAVREATRALFEKWMRLSPDEFRNICNLYHESCAALETTRQELATAKQALLAAESANRAQALTLESVYASRSWRLTWSLRQVKSAWMRLRSGRNGQSQ